MLEGALDAGLAADAALLSLLETAAERATELRRGNGSLRNSLACKS